jgi:hypothetical protein
MTKVQYVLRNITWFYRAVMWAKADVKREWKEIKDGLIIGDNGYWRDTKGGVRYVLSANLVIFAETLNQWGA